MQKQLLVISALGEVGAGLAFLAAPRATIRFLLELEVPEPALLFARIAGVVLIGLGLACWYASRGARRQARAGIVRAITLYDIAAGGGLVVLGASGIAAGAVLWLAAVLHLGLAGAFLAARRTRQ